MAEQENKHGWVEDEIIGRFVLDPQCIDLGLKGRRWFRQKTRNQLNED